MSLVDLMSEIGERVQLALDRLRVRLNPHPKANFIERAAENAFRLERERSQRIAESKERTRRRRTLT